LRLILHTTSTRKELESIMRLKNQPSLKRLTSKKYASFNTKPSLIAILLMVIALMQVPIALKSSFSLACLFSQANNTNRTLFFCND